MSEHTTPPIQPLGSRVLVQPIEEESRTAGGIFLPDTAKEKPQLGLVVAVGDDEEIKVQVGDKVIFPKYTGTEFRYNGTDYLIMEANDILAKLTEGR
ncbi:MAG: co-chaperone GroES [Armatimonadota bacterium]|nr:co-chaperone GroES [bacterium]MCS7308706.1 co-chaperone GroES [Armatimonadota bacterium]MDW8103591.1 co-chaperone GroES [Armatimonadota bacterium]MDW8289201.1 co-chaperone GroES [Armatimonadota bacterium]